MLRLSLRYLALLSITLIPASASEAGELVIIESQSDRYYSGEVLQNGCSVRLVEGETLTLLSESGKLSKLTGPHTGSPTLGSTPSAEPLLPALAALVTTSGADLNSMGGSRGLEAPRPTTPEPVDSAAWNLVPERGGTQCVVEGASVHLWRADSEATARLVIQKLEPSQTHETDWQGGDTRIAWPEAIPLTEGATYLIRVGHALPFHQIKLRKLSRSASSGAQAVGWLFARDCRAQARLLYEEIQGAAGIEELDGSSK